MQRLEKRKKEAGRGEDKYKNRDGDRWNGQESFMWLSRCDSCFYRYPPNKMFTNVPSIQLSVSYLNSVFLMDDNSVVVIIENL